MNELNDKGAAATRSVVGKLKNTEGIHVQRQSAKWEKAKTSDIQKEWGKSFLGTYHSSLPSLTKIFMQVSNYLI